MCVCVCVCVRARACAQGGCRIPEIVSLIFAKFENKKFQNSFSSILWFSPATYPVEMLDIDKFIVLVEEEVTLWDKNEVARAWKKVNRVLKNCAIKSRSVNRFGMEKSRNLNTILPHGLRVIFLHGKIA